MDTKKLSKIVKAIVSAEVKRQLPKLVEEQVNLKMKKVLTEVKKMQAESKKQKPTIQEEDAFSLANQVLAESRDGMGEPKPQLSMMDDEETRLSKNPMLDQILKETKPFSQSQRVAAPVGFESKIPNQVPLNEASGDGYEEYPTMNHNLTPTPGSTPVPADVKAQMAAKMGYGDMGSGPSKQGLGVTTGIPSLDRVLNRDNSALIKAWDKKK